MKTTFSLAIVAVGLLGSSVQAASDFHVDEVAAKLQRQTADLTYEIEHQFRGTSSYKHLLEDAVEMEDLARHIHDAAHNADSRRHIAADVRKLDRTIHHVEGLLDRMQVRSRRHSHGHNYGHYPTPRRGGRAFQIRQLQRMLGRISETVHHFQDDVRPVRSPVVYEVRRPRRSRRRAPVPTRPYFRFQF